MALVVLIIAQDRMDYMVLNEMSFIYWYYKIDMMCMYIDRFRSIIYLMYGMI